MSWIVAMTRTARTTIMMMMVMMMMMMMMMMTMIFDWRMMVGQ